MRCVCVVGGYHGALLTGGGEGDTCIEEEGFAT